MVWRRLRSPPVGGLDEFRETAAVGCHRAGLGSGTVLDLFPLTVLPRRFSPGRDLAAGDNHRQPLELWAAFFCSADNHLCLGGHACSPTKRLDWWTLGGTVRGGSRWLHCLDEESSQAFRIITSDRFLLHLRRVCFRHGLTVYTDGILQGLELVPAVSILCFWSSPGGSRPGGPFFPWPALGK